MLVDLIGRKMRDEGYTPVAYDGQLYTFRGEEVHIPPKIGRHRPDVVGINLESKALCIGEAKTGDDLLSERTREQLLDYSSIIGATSGMKFRLIIGVPMKDENALLMLMEDLGIDKLANVTHIVLPEELVDPD
jgi:hypothetical protein